MTQKVKDFNVDALIKVLSNDEETRERMSKYLASNFTEITDVIFDSSKKVHDYKKKKGYEKPYFLLLTTIGSAFFVRKEDMDNADRHTLPGFLGLNIICKCGSCEEEYKYLNSNHITLIDPISEEKFKELSEKNLT